MNLLSQHRRDLLPMRNVTHLHDLLICQRSHWRMFLMMMAQCDRQIYHRFEYRNGRCKYCWLLFIISWLCKVLQVLNSNDLGQSHLNIGIRQKEIWNERSAKNLFKSELHHLFYLSGEIFCFLVFASRIEVFFYLSLITCNYAITYRKRSISRTLKQNTLKNARQSENDLYGCGSRNRSSFVDNREDVSDDSSFSRFFCT